MIRTRWCIAALAAVVSLVFTSHASAQTRYVDPNGANAASGASWANAWETLEYALNELNTNGGFTTIWISHGGTSYAYKPGTSASDTYLVQRPVSIYGGFQGPSVSFPTGESALGQRLANARTTLSGDLGSSVHCDHIMVVEGAVLLNGMVLEDGGVPTAPATNMRGGAINAGPNRLGASVTLQDCQLLDNTASTEGGAVYVRDCWLDVRDCHFEGNHVYGRPSGGMSFGGPSDGGAISYGGESVAIALSTFHDNQALNQNDSALHAGGGAIHIDSTTLDAKVINCNFTANRASTGGDTVGTGGAVYEEKVHFAPQTYWVNCLFADNFAGDTGGAAYLLGKAEISQCTFSENEAPSNGGGIALHALGTSDSIVQNCVLWGNVSAGAGSVADEQIYQMSGTSYLMQETCVEGLATLTNGNLNSDPLFVNPGAGNFRLQATSPVINMGDASIRPLDYADLNGVSGTSDLHPHDLDPAHTRVVACDMDMGAYEHEPACLADFNEDGIIDGADMGYLLGEWGLAGAYGPADFNCDGVVDGADLGVLLGQWQLGCGEGFAFGGGGSGLEDLMSYMAVGTTEELAAALTELDFETMSALLTSFLGS